MKLISYLIYLLVITNASAGQNILTVYTYDALSSKHGLGPVIKKEYETNGEDKIVFKSFPTAGEALNQVVLEGKNTQADILLGIDNSLTSRAFKTDLFENNLVPFDYGYLAFIYDSSRTKLPKGINSLNTLIESKEIKKRIIIEDPRTSSLGLCFLVWTANYFTKEMFESSWKKLAEKIAVVSPGWSGAYGLFLKKEADYVLSYTTSPAYHIEIEKNEFYKSIEFKEGHYKQVESAVAVKSSKKKKEIMRFINVLLSNEIQENIPKTQWMYPIRNVKLPDAFKKILIPKSVEEAKNSTDDIKLYYLPRWLKAFGL